MTEVDSVQCRVAVELAREALNKAPILIGLSMF
jgi:hypothetical protein